MAIGDTVRNLREERAMSQQELADRSGLTQATISRIESGQVGQLKSDALRQLADVLNVTMDYLAGRTAEMRSDDLLQADPDAARLVDVYGRLSPDDRARVMEYALFLRFKDRVDVEQLGRLEELVSEPGELRGVDRQIAILRTLANLTDEEE